MNLSNELKGLALDLAEARAARKAKQLDPNSIVSDEETAFAVQAEAVNVYPSDRIGYKIGATSPEAQKLIGCDGPFFAPLFAADRFEPDDTVQASDTWIAIECEFAFRMSATPGSSTHDDLRQAIESCHPALEIVGRRHYGEGLPNLIASICDFGLNAGFCPGERIADWTEIDLVEAEVVGLVNGEETNRGRGGNVLGHPLNALGWLSDTLAAAGSPLRSGDWVSTGTCLGIVPIRPGVTITGDYGAFGSVSLTF